MAYGPNDTQAVETARQAGIRTKGIETKDSTHVVNTLLCPRIPNTDSPANILAQAIVALDRLMENTTVCVEVEGTSPVPSYVYESIDYLNGHHLKLVVVCDGASTHAPGNMLDEALCEKVSSVLTTGAMWHPVANTIVHVKR